MGFVNQDLDVPVLVFSYLSLPFLLDLGPVGRTLSTSALT